MDRENGSGKTVMGHSCDFAQLGFAEGGIGKYNSDGRIERRPDALDPKQMRDGFRPVQKPAVLCVGTGNLPSVLPVIDISEGIDCHDRADHQISPAKDAGTDSGFHGMSLSGILADRRAAAGSETAVPVIAAILFRFPAGRIGHSLVGTHRGVSHRQVENIHLCDKGHMDAAHFYTDPFFLKITHDAARGVKSEGTASPENSRMDTLGCCDRVQQSGLAAGRPAASYMQSRSHSGRILTQKDRNTGPSLCVLHLPYPDPRESRKRHLCDLVISPSFRFCQNLSPVLINPDRSSAVPENRLYSHAPPQGQCREVTGAVCFPFSAVHVSSRTFFSARGAQSPLRPWKQGRVH